jgi:hypothetical protein
MPPNTSNPSTDHQPSIYETPMSQNHKTGVQPRITRTFTQAARMRLPLAFRQDAKWLAHQEQRLPASVADHHLEEIRYHADGLEGRYGVDGPSVFDVIQLPYRGPEWTSLRGLVRCTAREALEPAQSGTVTTQAERTRTWKLANPEKVAEQRARAKARKVLQ